MYNKICLALYGVCAILANTMNEIGLMFVILSVLMVFDSVLGGLKHWRIQNFNSSELKRGVLSKAIAIGVIVCVDLAMGVADMSGGLVVNTAISMMIVAEVISIVQNWIVIKTGEDMQEQDAITDVMRWVLRKLQAMLKSVTK